LIGNPAESDLDDIAEPMGVGEAICTMREVMAVIDRPKDIEDEEAMGFFSGSEGDADESQGLAVVPATDYAAPLRSEFTDMFQALRSHSGM
jgi:hypothetical protein